MGILQRIGARLGKLVGRAKKLARRHKGKLGAAAFLYVAYRYVQARGIPGRGPRLDPERTVDVPITN